MRIKLFRIKVEEIPATELPALASKFRTRRVFNLATGDPIEIELDTRDVVRMGRNQGDNVYFAAVSEGGVGKTIWLTIESGRDLIKALEAEKNE